MFIINYYEDIVYSRLILEYKNKVNKTLKSMYSILEIQKNEVIITRVIASIKTKLFLNIFNIYVMLCLSETVINICIGEIYEKDFK